VTRGQARTPCPTVVGVSYGSTSGPLAIAHRGGAGLATENTLDAFACSYGLGLRYLETDARVTADGVCVAFHDAGLRRLRRRPGLVREMSSHELDAPSIGDLLDAFPDAYFAIDVKEAAAVRPLARAIRVVDAAHRVCAAGAWDGWLAGLRAELGPSLTTALGWRALATLLASAPAKIVPPWWHNPARFAHVPVRLVGRRTIARAHMLGVHVVVWTVNDPPSMHQLLDAGVDGIITDRPDLLRDVLIARDQWVAPESEDRVSEAGSGRALPS
jgi:glycerophosphoryl diester phosphodiesterase